jgi:hypothetical protein
MLRRKERLPFIDSEEIPYCFFLLLPLLIILLLFTFWNFKTVSHYVTQPGLELSILLP